MKIVSRFRHRKSTDLARGHRELARALRSAPTQASREELYLLQNR